MDEDLARGRDLLYVEEVAEYLGVTPVTVWRWCRDGRLPCMKIARSWRIRRAALEDFLERSERSETLSGRLRLFLEVPDNVLTIAQDREMMHRLDAAFFRVGEARGGILVKYHRNPNESEEEVREVLQSNGLDASRLEKEGRFRIIFEEKTTEEGRVGELERLAAELSDEGRTVWVNFNWEVDRDLDVALEHQRAITESVESSGFVVATSVLESVLDEWPGKTLRRAQVLHSGTIWLSESGLSLNRVTPPPSV